MPTRLFSSRQRAAFDAFPEVLSDEDRDRFFRFSDADRRFAARFGDGAVDVAVMLGSLRMLGFVPGSVTASHELVDFVTTGLNMTRYDDVVEVVERSRRHRVAAVVEHAGWRRPNRSDLKSLDDWLLERAMEHDKGPGLRSIIPAGKNWGSSGHWYFAEHGLDEPEELWWRYWVQFPEGFYIEPPNRGKLPGVGGLYTYNCLGGRPSTAAEPCFSARMLFSRTYPSFGQPGYPDGPDDQTLIGYYVYHLDSPSNRGDIWTWDPEVAALDHGTWYCVEGHIDLNTPGANDGTLRGWVDGTAAFSKTDIAFRRANESAIDIKSFWFDIYYGGDTSVADNEIHFDSLALGPERVGCGDTEFYEPPFRDDEGSVFETDIIWLASAGITQGCNPPVNDRFCPSDGVSREQMAAFLVRALTLPDAGGSDPFVDDDRSVFESAIESLEASGITKGCNPPTNDRFCPQRKLTRAEMATFLTRAFSYADPGGDSFVDDDESIFESAIEALAAAGVTRGCNPPTNDRFCPDSFVTRAEMAAFLHRALG